MEDIGKIKKIAERYFCYDFIVLNKIRGEKGNLLEFKNHKFLIDVLDDWTPIQTVRKASQIGFSTAMILKALWAAKNRKYNIIYTLPTFNDVSNFVPSKVNSIIQNNQILALWTQDKDTIFQKKIGNSFIYFRGAHPTKAEVSESGVGIMLTSDLNIMDECDRSHQGILEQYQSRLEASSYKGQWFFSNPTHPQTLSQILWEESDQKHWFIKCSHCNEWQYLEWPDNVRNGKFVCKRCGGEITDEDRINGEWIKKWKDRKISGYWISQLMCPWQRAEEIEEKAKKFSKDYFYNFVLGLPYRGGEGVVDRDLILKCVDHSMINFKTDNVLGVDVGREKHFVLGNKEGIFKIGKVNDWEDIEILIKKYDVKTAVIDALPDLTIPKKLQEKYPGIVWLSYFQNLKVDFTKLDKNTHTIYSDRSKMIGLLIEEMVERKIRFQIDVKELDEYIKHWLTIYKTKVDDSLGSEKEVWETEGENHFVFATLYFRLGLEMQGGKVDFYSEGKKENVNINVAPKIEDFLKTPKDWRI